MNIKWVNAENSLDNKQDSWYSSQLFIIQKSSSNFRLSLLDYLSVKPDGPPTMVRSGVHFTVDCYGWFFYLVEKRKPVNRNILTFIFTCYPQLKLM